MPAPGTRATVLSLGSSSLTFGYEEGDTSGREHRGPRHRNSPGLLQRSVSAAATAGNPSCLCTTASVIPKRELVTQQNLASLVTKHSQVKPCSQG